jgi:hypothetical protein
MEMIKWLESIRKKYKGVVGYSTELQKEIVKGKPSGRDAIRIYVKKKIMPGKLSKSQLLPDEVFGIPVDVVEIGEVEFQSDPKSRLRPLVGGISTSCKGSGTMGYLCKDGNGNWYALSCAHVYGLKIGKAVRQPSRNDGGKLPDDQIGVVTRSVYNRTVDASIARIDEQAEANINDLYPPLAIGAASVGQKVTKSGKNTGVTIGTVIDTNARLKIGSSNGSSRWMEKLIIVEPVGTAPFSKGGDSGSLLVATANKTAVGLHIAGSGMRSISTPIFEVLHALKVRLVDAGSTYP